MSAGSRDGELRLGDWVFPNLEGEVTFSVNHERRWTMSIALSAGPLALQHGASESQPTEEDDGAASEPEPEFPNIELGCVLDVDHWRELQGCTLRLEGDEGNGWIQLRDEFEAVWDVMLSFDHADNGRVRVKLDARACPNWEPGKPYLPLSFDTVLRLGGDAAPRMPDRSADCPLGRKECHSCKTVSFDVTPSCPKCGVGAWWHE